MSVLETPLSNRIRAEASRKGYRLWRNNIGAAKTETGSWVRFGLANDSKEVNDVIKSADLIGIKPVLITPAHVGSVIGQFLSVEVKREDWKSRDTKRERAQRAWKDLIEALGGDARIINREGEL